MLVGKSRATSENIETKLYFFFGEVFFGELPEKGIFVFVLSDVDVFEFTAGSEFDVFDVTQVVTLGGTLVNPEYETATLVFLVCKERAVRRTTRSFGKID